MNFTEITSHEIACRVLEKSPSDSTNIHDQLDDIADAINVLDGKFAADFNNSEKKWRPFFRVDASGFRFDSSGCVISASDTDVGSRLCCYFRSKETADHYGKAFEEMHRKVYFRRKPIESGIKGYKEIMSHEIACRVIDKDPNLSQTADQKIIDITKAFNKLSGFVADFNNEKEKWRPFFRVDASGFRFVSSVYAGSDSTACVGSRLCYYVSSEEEANFIGQHFIELHKAHYYAE